MENELQTRQIADFALRTTFENIGKENIDQLKKHLLDSFGSLLHATKKPADSKTG